MVQRNDGKRGESHSDLSIRATFSISSFSSDTMNALTIRKPISNETSCESIRIEGPAIGRRDLAYEPVVQLWMLYLSEFRLLEAFRHQAPLILGLRSCNDI